MGDGAGGTYDVGICLTDTEASNPDVITPWTCDCDALTEEKCAYD